MPLIDPMPTDTNKSDLERSHPDWFREPTRREHAIAAALFVGYGIFFAVLFVVLAGWWFRWVILGLGVISVLHGLWHAIVAPAAPRAHIDP